jgi:hypothetical protein
VKWQQVLGNKDFLQQIKDRWNQKETKPRVYARKRAWSAELGAEEIIKKVGKYFGMKPMESLIAATGTTLHDAVRWCCAGI